MKITRYLVALLSLWAGLALAPAAQAQPLVIGQVAPFSGSEATQGRAYSFGIQLHLDQVNKAGGVHGRPLVLKHENDRGLSEQTVTLTRKLLDESRPLVLAGYFGNLNLADLLKSGMLEKEKIALVGYRITDVSLDSPWLYNVRAGLKDEIQKIASHLSTVGIKRLGLLQEDNSGAAALLAVTEEAMTKAGATLVARAAYPAGLSTPGNTVETFLATPPQAIILVGSATVTAAFIEEYRAAGGRAQLFAHSGTDIEQLSKRLSEAQVQGLAISQVTPNPYKIMNPLTREFRDVYAAHPDPDVPISYSMLEGYIAAKVIVEALRRAGPGVNRDSFVKALGSMEPTDLGGYQVGFRNGRRTGAGYVDLSIVSSTGRIRQ